MASTVTAAPAAGTAVAPGESTTAVVGPPTARPPRLLLARLRHLQHGPVLVVAVVLAVALVPWLAIWHGNATGFIHFGRLFTSATRPPPHAVIFSRTGYDGQYFWALARDPLLLSHRTVTGFAQAGFRLERVAYPALAFVLAAGQAPALPWTLLVTNVVAVLLITAVFAGYAVRRGWSPWWALCVGLLPGFIVATVGDMSDVVATSTMLAGLMMWRERRPWVAGILLAVAALAREPMILATVAVGLEMAAHRWSSRARAMAGAGTSDWAWPVLAVPVVAFAAWQVYIRIRFPGSVLAGGTAYQPPLVAWLTEASHSVRRASFGGGWDLGYLALMFGGVVASLRLAVRSFTAPAIAAALFALSLLILSFGSDWSYTRLSAPMFAALLLAGLERHDRPARYVCVAVAAAGVLAPVALG